MTTTEMNTEVKNNELVKSTILAVRIMWDCRKEKSFYYATNWLEGMDKNYTKVLSMLFFNYAEGHETTNTFAKRLAGIKN